jgi:hypothetical protein
VLLLNINKLIRLTKNGGAGDSMVKPDEGSNDKRRLIRFIQKFPWLWVDLVVARINLPPWLLSIGLFSVLFICGSIISLVAGEPVGFLLDIRRIIVFSLPAFASFNITIVRQNIKKLETGLKPWIASPDADIEVFWAKTPLWLMRGFWFFALIWLAIIPSLYLFMHNIVNQGSPPVSGVAAPPRTIAHVGLFMAPIVAYFMGSVTAIATMGLATLAHNLRAGLDLKEGFVLRGAKEVLRPLTHLFWVTWFTIALPLLLIGTLAVTSGNLTSGRIPLNPMDIIPLALVAVILILAVVVPQIFINRFLGKEKQEAVDNIRAQIDQAITVGEGESREDILLNMHRFQSLIYREEKVYKFSPTMIDTKFLIQLAAVITTVLSAFFGIRTFINLFISG